MRSPRNNPQPSLISLQGADAGAGVGGDAGAAGSVIYFHVHLISDSTGETLNAMLKATSAQFANVHPIEHSYALVRSQNDIDRVLSEVEAAPGIVLYTLMNDTLRQRLEVRCLELQVPAISVLDPLLNAFAGYLGAELSLRPGAQHEMDDAYFRRIAALDYTLAHDDGQMIWDLENADVVLVGVSRTSKTPTCMYLAHRGIKAANVPIVPGAVVPGELERLSNPLVIGLTASPDRLVQIRRNRLMNLSAQTDSTYADAHAVRDETIYARKLFSKNNWPVIDVTRRSIEETAAAVLNKISERRNDAGES